MANEAEMQVKAKWPDAEHIRDPLYGVSEICSMSAARGPHSYSTVGRGNTEAEAWQDAASRLAQSKEGQ